jgi:hypothetical protein
MCVLSILSIRKSVTGVVEIINWLKTAIPVGFVARSSLQLKSFSVETVPRLALTAAIQYLKEKEKNATLLIV